MEEVLLLNKFFFRLSIYAFVVKIESNKVVEWCEDGDFLCHFCVLYFERATCSTFQTCILNSHTMCRSMVDIQYAAGEIGRGIKKKQEERNHRAKI